MEIQAIAQKLLNAELSKQPIAPLTESEPNITADDAYRIQLHQIEQKVSEGAVVKGLKIGLTSKVMQEMLNVHTPDYGFILDTMIFQENIAIDTERFIQPKVEFEIAFVFKEALKGPNVTIQDVIDATDYVVPSIEIIDSRIEDWRIKFEDTVADNGSSAGAVLGTRKTQLSNIDIANIGMTVYKNDECIDKATSDAVLGNPLNAVVWLANEVSSYDISIQPGMFVLSGALSKALPFTNGDHFKADFGKLGEVSISFQKAEVKQ
ncbi:2-keto-4-pentenoate hydratase [Psychrobacillus insolitus]|uniref:2-keto-4-pentenoate hydratase n=1 Tax=Psychrobacillus insolitus TaxID=1461 RepID=A0A2W7MIP3_9BACI|nr:2-keto-4-pentenoate hydratase [Psychrobacillus insolitus]PZX02949.1 2-keto-4-pentenoate hydratase [Psychrobacillus insolitus]